MSGRRLGGALLISGHASHVGITSVVHPRELKAVGVLNPCFPLAATEMVQALIAKRTEPCAKVLWAI
jgi:hypothetical protein